MDATPQPTSEPEQSGDGPGPDDGPARDDGPGPDDWIPVMLGFARDRSADGWAFTNIRDVQQALADHRLVAAVQAPGDVAAPDLIQARVAVHPDGSLATLPDPHGPMVAGPRLEEVVSGLAHGMKTVIMVDGEIAIGTAGVPLEEPPAHMLVMTEDRRLVYAWPGTDRFVAEIAATQLKEEVTWHDVEGWTVLASPHAPTRVLHGLSAAAERLPFVTVTRRGPERTVHYVAGKGPDDLRLMAGWAPWFEPLVLPGEPGEEAGGEPGEEPGGDDPIGAPVSDGTDPVGAPVSDGTDPDVVGLRAMLCHPRLGEDEMEEHRDLREDQRRAISEAMADRDGSHFLARVCEALEVPTIAARLAEQRIGDPAADLVGEPVRARGRLELARTMMKETTAEGRVETAYERKVQRRMTAVELVTGVALLVLAALDILPGPWWLWLVLGLLLTGDGIHTLVSDARSRRAAPPAAGDTAPHDGPDTQPEGDPER